VKLIQMFFGLTISKLMSEYVSLAKMRLPFGRRSRFSYNARFLVFHLADPEVESVHNAMLRPRITSMLI
jgi:hypothetical protein